MGDPLAKAAVAAVLGTAGGRKNGECRRKKEKLLCGSRHPAGVRQRRDERRGLKLDPQGTASTRADGLHDPALHR